MRKFKTLKAEKTKVLSEIIQNRRTRKPSKFLPKPVPSFLIKELIDCARHAPNHHRTEPARFYLLNSSKIQEVGNLFGEVLAGDGSNPTLVEKGERKKKEWGESPGLLIVTCHTDRESALVQNRPAIIDEDYATTSCICQNLCLLFEAEGLGCKWSTGAVWEHPDFSETIQMKDPNCERVVALLFYGYSEQSLGQRSLSPLADHLISEY